MARSPRTLPAVPVVDEQAENARKVQAAIDATMSATMRDFMAAEASLETAREALKAEVAKVGSVKVAIMLKLARASRDWTDEQIKLGLDAAMKVWAGNTRKTDTPVARRLRSEFNLAMLPEVRSNAADVIEKSKLAWEAEQAEYAADLAAYNADTASPKTAKVPTRPLFDKFWGRMAELQLFNLRQLKPEKEMRGPRGARVETTTREAVKLTDRAAMVAYVAPKAVSVMDQATADAAKVLADIKALGVKYKSEEHLKPVCDLFEQLATAAALVGRLNAIAAAAPAPAPAPAAAPAPVVEPEPAPVPAPAATPVAGAIDPAMLAGIIAALKAQGIG